MNLPESLTDRSTRIEAVSLILAGIAVTRFYGELRRRAWRYAAHLALGALLAVALWTYWPRK